MLLIPIVDTFSQSVSAQLGGQSCTLSLYQKSIGFYCDVYVNDTLIIGGVLCHDQNLIVRDLYLGFVGDLMFLDTQGNDDPSSPGLGTRWQLYYLDAADVAGVDL